MTVQREESSRIDDTIAALSTLAFQRTVDRSTVHRASISEVFITDGRKVSDSAYVVAAQVPPSHAYYRDQLLDRTVVDPTLLLECCRQAETYGGHLFQDIGPDEKFILRSWSMRLPGLLAAPSANRPAELAMTVRTRGRQLVGQRTGGLSYGIGMSIDGIAVGDVTIDVAYLSAETYTYLRNRGRRGAAPSSDDVAAVASNVIPARVGRRDPANVLLRDAVVDAGEAVATVRPAVDNPSTFDHPQDHVPGMVLTDAARQLCVLAGPRLTGAAPERTTMAGFDLSFARYAELDSPVEVRVHPGGDPDPVLAAALPEVRAWQVSVHQHDAVIAGGVLFTTTLPQVEPRLAGAR
ncbi:AfsA-related hotdog domain-containing protein [Krasilnikovia sp. M28-CT-15]|uniref:AfsA-related hotdog domain-containing protein n=1 Tax=Krasilnikovia sp. M28-CT-15 TaxID=3373540 RepID=UPI003875D165